MVSAEDRRWSLRPARRDGAQAGPVVSRAQSSRAAPGVGKTTLVSAILLIPSGKESAVSALWQPPRAGAAKRLSEATGARGQDKSHRLKLEAQRPRTSRFGEMRPTLLTAVCWQWTKCRWWIVALMANLLRALPPKASLLMVGDIDQLPSVGPGMVLRHDDRKQNRAGRATDGGLPSGGR